MREKLDTTPKLDITYKHSVYEVIDEKGTKIGTYTTLPLAEIVQRREAALRPNDHGSFIKINEIKVYGGILDDE